MDWKKALIGIGTVVVGMAIYDMFVKGLLPAKTA